MASQAVVLNNGTNITGSSVTTAVSYSGGRSVFIVEATQYAGLFSFQLQGPGGAWQTINESNITTNSALNYDLPAGQYRLLSTQGSSVAVYSKIVSIPYP